MGDLYNPEEECSYLQYLDINNLYGCAMIQLLPTGEFKWEKQVEKFTTTKIANLVQNGRKGYLLVKKVQSDQLPTECLAQGLHQQKYQAEERSK